MGRPSLTCSRSTPTRPSSSYSQNNLTLAYPDPAQRAHATHWLSWIARHMGTNRDLRWWDIPTWAPGWHSTLAFGLAFGLASVLAGGLAGLVMGPAGGLAVGLVRGRDRPCSWLWWRRSGSCGASGCGSCHCCRPPCTNKCYARQERSTNSATPPYKISSPPMTSPPEQLDPS
jgi:hypothetical protein